MKTVILAPALGYPVEQLEDFISGVCAQLDDFELVIFTDRITKQDLQKLAYPDRITLVKKKFGFAPLRVLYGKRKISKLCALILYPILRLIRFVSHSAFKTIADALLFPSVCRYLWFAEYIKGVDDDAWVIMSDTKDVIFQGDPTNGCDPTRLHTGVEEQLFRDCVTNTSWLKYVYPKSAGDLSASRVICSGFSFGKSRVVEEYLEKMVGEILRLAPKIVFQHGYDQAIHNHLLRFVFPPEFARLHSCFEGGIATLGTFGFIDEAPYSINNEGVFLFSDNQPGVLHMFDRLEARKNYSFDKVRERNSALVQARVTSS